MMPEHFVMELAKVFYHYTSLEKAGRIDIKGIIRPSQSGAYLSLNNFGYFDEIMERKGE